MELLPPEGSGFSPDPPARLLAVSQAGLIAELLKRGYTKVETVRG